jgi:uncharacterized protein YciI
MAKRKSYCYSAGMKIWAFSLFAIGALQLCGADEKTSPAPAAEPKYEMTTYVMGLLHKGPKWTAENTAYTRGIQEGHMANIRKMANTGKLIVAGPISDNGELRGVFIFKLSSVDEARAMVDADPAVKAGRLVVELHPWFAAAGLKVNPPK